MRNIAVITGSRAEYGLLYWIIKEIHEDTDLDLQLIVTGMHLSPEFGLTVHEIENDGFPVAERVEMLLSADTEASVAASMGLGMIGFAKAYERLKPDIIVVLGDRFEILSAVAAAAPFRVPVAHIHGGESTEGVMDELFRHAITKMSHIHFTSTEKYSGRILQMGENPQNVFCFGAPGLDNVYRLTLMAREELLNTLGISGKERIGVVTYHPVTAEDAGKESSELLSALVHFPEIFWVFTMPNADTGGRVIIRAIEDFVGTRPDMAKAFTSLGRMKYLSLLKHSVVMIGNSSSGLIEAPSFNLPVVNIGDRQQGRIRAQNVIDVPECKKEVVIEAIRKVLNPEFREALKGIHNPYGTGDASRRIVGNLKIFSLDKGIIKKSFIDRQ